MNWVLISQKKAFFKVTAMRISNLPSVQDFVLENTAVILELLLHILC
jgi:hypothetical protein